MLYGLKQSTWTRHMIPRWQCNNGGSDGGLLSVERLASQGLDAGRIAWLTTRRILTSLSFDYLVGLWLV
jgi:hypothetical protein